jgi:hypothetical protein
MDELEISGKRYISSKRIAKENRYHADYIGQLIRGGKISGTKVGRAWYVEEESFADYLNKEHKTYTAPVQNTEVPASRALPVVAEVGVISTIEPKQTISVVAVAEPATLMTERVAVTIQEHQAPVQFKKVGLTYLSDNSPLFPEIPKRSKEITRAMDADVVYTHEPIDSVEHVPARKKGSSVLRFFAGATLFVFAAALACFVFFVSVGINSTVVVEKGKPASVAYSQEKTFCFIFGSCQNQ